MSEERSSVGGSGTSRRRGGARRGGGVAWREVFFLLEVVVVSFALLLLKARFALRNRQLEVCLLSVLLFLVFLLLVVVRNLDDLHRPRFPFALAGRVAEEATALRSVGGGEVHRVEGFESESAGGGFGKGVRWRSVVVLRVDEGGRHRFGADRETLSVRSRSDRPVGRKEVGERRRRRSKWNELVDVAFLPALLLRLDLPSRRFPLNVSQLENVESPIEHFVGALLEPNVGFSRGDQDDSAAAVAEN
jgi:hypothetical protein